MMKSLLALETFLHVVDEIVERIPHDTQDPDKIAFRETYNALKDFDTKKIPFDEALEIMDRHIHKRAEVLAKARAIMDARFPSSSR